MSVTTARFVEDKSSHREFVDILDARGLVCNPCLGVQGVPYITGITEDRSEFSCLVIVVHMLHLTRDGSMTLRTLGRGEVYLIDGV